MGARICSLYPRQKQNSKNSQETLNSFSHLAEIFHKFAKRTGRYVVFRNASIDPESALRYIFKCYKNNDPIIKIHISECIIGCLDRLDVDYEELCEKISASNLSHHITNGYLLLCIGVGAKYILYSERHRKFLHVAQSLCLLDDYSREELAKLVKANFERKWDWTYLALRLSQQDIVWIHIVNGSINHLKTLKMFDMEMISELLLSEKRPLTKIEIDLLSNEIPVDIALKFKHLNWSWSLIFSKSDVSPEIIREIYQLYLSGRFNHEESLNLMFNLSKNVIFPEGKNPRDYADIKWDIPGLLRNPQLCNTWDETLLFQFIHNGIIFIQNNQIDWVEMRQKQSILFDKITFIKMDIQLNIKNQIPISCKDAKAYVFHFDLIFISGGHYDLMCDPNNKEDLDFLEHLYQKIGSFDNFMFKIRCPRFKSKPSFNYILKYPRWNWSKTLRDFNWSDEEMIQIISTTSEFDESTVLSYFEILRLDIIDKAIERGWRPICWSVLKNCKNIPSKFILKHLDKNLSWNSEDLLQYEFMADRVSECTKYLSFYLIRDLCNIVIEFI